MGWVYGGGGCGGGTASPWIQACPTPSLTPQKKKEFSKDALPDCVECHEVVGNLDHNRVALESLVIPNLHKLRPFFLRKSLPHNNDEIVGPIIPFPDLLIVLNKFCNGCSNMEGAIFFQKPFHLSSSFLSKHFTSSKLGSKGFFFSFSVTTFLRLRSQSAPPHHPLLSAN
ncbi:hypothetical protein VNO80_07148 [Phaseolus coccineus]|uniref:Uncharacterized protein n=1 Tax=Phaseolus coccineus TaxID=3886 RepID=A0AAN9NMX2_PHACN